MARQLVLNYVFDPAARTVTFVDFTSIKLGQIFTVNNAAESRMIFNFSKPGMGGSVMGNVLTLDFDTTAMDASDELTILFEPAPGDPNYATATQVEFENEPIDIEVDGTPWASTVPGVPHVALVGPLGQPIDVDGGSLRVIDVNGGDQVLGGSSQSGIVRGQRVVGSFQEFRFTTGTGTTLTPWFDAGAYRSVSVQILTNVSAVTFQGSADASVALSHSLVNIAAIGGSIPAVSGTGPAAFAGTLRTRFFRLSVAGVQQIVLTFFTEPMDNNGVPTLPVAPATSTPATAGVANAVGALTSNQNEVNAPTAAGVIGSWFPQVDVTDGRITAGTALGLGLTAAGLTGQFDDVAPVTVTEGRFGALRMTKNRAQHQALRDGSPWSVERGAEVTSRLALRVEDVQSGQFGDDPIFQVVPGVQGVALTDELGAPLRSRGGALEVVDATPLALQFALADFGTVTVMRAEASAVKALVVTNASAALCYAQVYDLAREPMAGDVPVFSFPVPAGTATQPSMVEMGANVFGQLGFALADGLIVAISTAAGSYTAATAADHTINALYR